MFKKSPYWSLACLYTTCSLKIGMLHTKYMIVAHKWLLAVVDSTAWMHHADPIGHHRSIHLDWISITVIDKFHAQVACIIPSWLSSASHSKVPSFDSTIPFLCLVYCTVWDLEQGTVIMVPVEEHIHDKCLSDQFIVELA